MNYTKQNPKGIDIPIHQMQTRLYEKLNWGDIETYGRVYKNPDIKEKGTIIKPEAFIGKKEYKDVLTNDLKNATIFFVDGNHHKRLSERDYTVDLKVIVLVNLKKTYPDISHRADMEAEISVVRLLNWFPFFKQKTIEKSIDVIFREFDTSKIKLSDMQPYHAFAVQGTLEYIMDDC